jgi:hypothetical protein
VRDSAVAEPTLFLLRVIAAGASEMCFFVGVLREESGFIFIVHSFFNCSCMMRSASSRNDILNKIGFGELKSQ